MGRKRIDQPRYDTKSALLCSEALGAPIRALAMCIQINFERFHIDMHLRYSLSLLNLSLIVCPKSGKFQTLPRFSAYDNHPKKTSTPTPLLNTTSISLNHVFPNHCRFTAETPSTYRATNYVSVSRVAAYGVLDTYLRKNLTWLF